MTPYVLSLADENATLENVGGKGMSLANLSRASLPVPDGFHVTTDAYRRFVHDNGLQARILDSLRGVDPADTAALEAASLQIGEYFTRGQMPAEIAGAISAAYSAMADIPVAVRSSATAEDLPEASFAGQQETYLNIRGAQAVLEAVKKCWASLWTARAIAYRNKQGISPDSLALAVVIQELVFADAAGIMFTANPVNGKRGEVMITAAWGLGEAIVSGAVIPDTLTVAKATGSMIRRETAQKQVMTVRTETGTREQQVPKSQQKKEVLSNAQAAEIAKIGADIEKLYGMPMDIEWTLAGGKFAIVQARPITAMPPEPLEWPLPYPTAVLARGSFAEFVPEPVSPLFATLAVPIAHKASLKLMAGMGLTEKTSYLFEVLNGYVYIGFVFTPKMALFMMKVSLQLIGPMIKSTPQRAVTAREKFAAMVQKWQAREPAGLAPSELLAGVREIFTETAEYYTVAQSGMIPLAMAGEMIFGSFYKLLVKRKNDPKAEVFVFGTENHALRSEKVLFDLALWVKGQPGLADFLTRTPAVEVVGALGSRQNPTPGLDEFFARFNAYLHEFGHAIYDLDFAKPTQAEDPTPLVESLKIYLTGRNNPYERQRAALAVREKAESEISKRLDPLRRKYFLKLLKWAQDTAPLREDSIANLGLGHLQIRRMLLELGRRLAAGGAMNDAEEVFWLEAQEADAMAVLLEKAEPLTNHSSEIARRKAKWQAMRLINPPVTLPRVGWVSKFYPNNDQTGDTIKGFGASGGKVTARACVLLGPEDFHKLQQGDVLVAGITTPAWTPLFGRAAAIVTDIGGPLSHSSIVAREYGIPAVLATGNGTRRIKDGQMVTVDGTAGTVVLV